MSERLLQPRLYEPSIKTDKMIDQIINYVNVERFQIGVIVGLVLFLILFLLSKIGKKKSFDKDSFYKDVISINENIRNSQKENIAAQKKLNNLYKMFKEVEGKLK